MTIIQDQRERVASVIGAKLANEFSDDQLPAILHAINGSEHEVRIIAQKVARNTKADSPAALMLWMLREKRHTGLVIQGPAQPYGVPALPSDEERATQRERAREWARIHLWRQRRQDVAELFATLSRTDPDPASIRRQMIECLDEMEAT